MDIDLAKEINQAVDRGDEQVRQELLQRFGEIKLFAEGLTLASGLTGKEVLESVRQPLALDSAGIVRLVNCLSLFRNTIPYPPPIARWYLKANAWSLADAGLWDEFPSD